MLDGLMSDRRIVWSFVYRVAVITLAVAHRYSMMKYDVCLFSIKFNIKSDE